MIEDKYITRFLSKISKQHSGCWDWTKSEDIHLIKQAIKDGFKTRIIAFYYDVRVGAINNIKYGKAHINAQ